MDCVSFPPIQNLIWCKSEADMDRAIMIRRKYRANALLITFSFMYCYMSQMVLKQIRQWERFKRSSNSSEWQQFSRIKRKMHFIYKTSAVSKWQNMSVRKNIYGEYS